MRVPTTPQWVTLCVESEIELCVSGRCMMKGSTATIFIEWCFPEFGQELARGSVQELRKNGAGRLRARRDEGSDGQGLLGDRAGTDEDDAVGDLTGEDRSMGHADLRRALAGGHEPAGEDLLGRVGIESPQRAELCGRRPEAD